MQFHCLSLYRKRLVSPEPTPIAHALNELVKETLARLGGEPTYFLFVCCCCCWFFCHVNSSPHFVRNVWKVGLSRIALTCLAGVRKGRGRELGRETAREGGGRKQWLACRRSPPPSALARPNPLLTPPRQRRFLRRALGNRCWRLEKSPQFYVCMVRINLEKFIT